ncbi:hypothetical protein AB6A40_000820 [Gnathostoma spinigerum]|uniref:FBA domain-containing protein n=1 Tax=Gnathostoma spinigerum TaxID=75299 RepID=A0ABD6E9P3_9BILA
MSHQPYTMNQQFELNLIDNPSGEKGWNGWERLSSGGDGFLIERTSSNEEFRGKSVPFHFATSFGLCRKKYIVDLWAHGFEQKFLDEHRPPITVSTNYKRSPHAGCTYILEAELVSDGGKITAGERSLSNVGSGRWGQPTLIKLDPDKDTTTDTKIVRVRDMDEDSDTDWHYLEHTFTSYPPGIRYVIFVDSGKDTKFWKGHYGARMANASVVVHKPNH